MTSTLPPIMKTQCHLLLYTQYYPFLFEHAYTPATVTRTVVPVMTKLLKRLGGWDSSWVSLSAPRTRLPSPPFGELSRLSTIQWRSQATILSEPAYSPCPCMCIYTYTFSTLHLHLLHLQRHPLHAAIAPHTLHWSPYITQPWPLLR